MGERDPTTPHAVELELVRRITDLDASAYSYPRGPAASWHEAAEALTVTGDAANLSHLAFNVWTEVGRNGGIDRNATSDGYLWADLDVVVAFSFRLRPTQQVADMRLTSDAAIDVLRALLAEWPADQPCVQIDVPEGDAWYTPALTEDGEWAVVVMQFSAAFDIRLDTSPESTPPNPVP